MHIYCLLYVSLYTYLFVYIYVCIQLGKIERGKRRGRQRMRWLDGIPNSMDMSFSKLQELVMDRRRGVLQSMGSQRVGHDWASEKEALSFFKGNYTCSFHDFFLALGYFLIFNENSYVLESGQFWFLIVFILWLSFYDQWIRKVLSQREDSTEHCGLSHMM